MRVVQCYDDGLVDDIRLIAILRRCGAKAAFCLIPGLYLEHRTGWRDGDREILRISADEMQAVYKGFEIVSHSMTHPVLTDLTPDRMAWETGRSREILQSAFGQPVGGFCYPFNSYDQRVKDAVRAAGYVWARGNGDSGTYPPADSLEFHPSCHFLAPYFWDKYREVREKGGVFFFWGHSYELRHEHMWYEFEKKIEGENMGSVPSFL